MHDRRSPGWTVAAAVAATAFLCACEPEVRVVRDGFASLPLDPKVDPSLVNQKIYSIELERYVGPARHQKAQALVNRLRKEARFTGVDIRDNAGFTIVSYGRFGDPYAPDALAAVQRVRAIELDGMRPYANAGFNSATADGGGSDPTITDPLNLKRYPGMYTLQIGFYDDRFGPNYRQAAEDAVKQLRQDKIEAYFYHGPHHSIITVDLLSREEAFVEVENPLAPGTKIEAYSQAVRDLRKKYPFNLGNGVTLIEKNKDGQVIGEQPSSLVRIPD